MGGRRVDRVEGRVTVREWEVSDGKNKEKNGQKCGQRKVGSKANDGKVWRGHT